MNESADDRSTIEIRRSEASDYEWLIQSHTDEWGSPLIERTGEFLDAMELDSIVVIDNGERVGLATLLHTDGETEIVTIKSFDKYRGIGSEMLHWIEADAFSRGSETLKVFTTNDNLDAIRFYQRRGFRLERIWKDSITEARKIKTMIPLEGSFGIPLCDEIELHKAILAESN